MSSIRIQQEIRESLAREERPVQRDIGRKNEGLVSHSLQSSSPRVRQAKARYEAEEAAQVPVPDSMAKMWDQSAREEKVRLARLRDEKEKERAERQRRHEETLKQHKVQQEIERQRQADLLAEQERLKQFLRDEQARLVEESLLTAQITQVCEHHGLTVEQVRAIGEKLKAQGVEKFPPAWDWAARGLEEK